MHAERYLHWSASQPAFQGLDPVHGQELRQKGLLRRIELRLAEGVKQERQDMARTSRGRVAR